MDYPQEFGLFSVDEDTRTVRGIIVPWNEESRTNQTRNAPVKFRNGDIRVPRDHTVVVLNRQHDRYDPVGHGVRFEPVEAGLYAEYRIAETDEGDEWLADHGDLVRLSPELRDIVRHADGTATATLTGSALVTEGAFASAGLFAVDPDDDDENVVPSVNVTPDAAPAVEEEEPAEGSDETQEDTVAEASASEVMLAAGRGAAPAAEPLTRNGLFALVQKVGAGQGSQRDIDIVKEAFRRESGLFALDDITYNAAGDIAPLLPKQWLGEVVDGTTYSQTFAPLFGQQNLTSLYMTGWRWVTKPAGATWAGNKAEVPSNPVSFEQVSDTATRWAGANDIAREHRDFGTPGFFEAYDREMRKSFMEWLDALVLTEALAAATPLEADNPAGLTIGAGWSALIDGAVSIVEAGLRPTGAVVASALYKSMLKAPASDILGYLAGAIGIAEGELEGFTFRSSASITAGHALVVARSAGDVYTLPGSPVRAEALNIANGGIDVGFFGYGGFFLNNAEGIVDVGPYTP